MSSLHHLHRIADLLFKARAAALAMLPAVLFLLPNPASSQSFIGNFQPAVYYDVNVFDGVQLATDAGNVLVTPGQSSNNLNLAFTYSSRTLNLPLTMSGNIARLTTPNIVVGGATILDAIMVTDGNNTALAYLERFNAGTPNVRTSFAIAHWQAIPSSALPAQITSASWATTLSYGNYNIRNAAFPVFTDAQGDDFAFNISSSPFTISSPGNFQALPLVQNGASLYIPGTPFATPFAVIHSFDMMFDNAGFGSIITIASELNDPADVSLGISLFAQVVPEPNTLALALVGLVGLMVRLRSALIAPPR